MCEVPQSASRCDNKLCTSNYEGADPEQSKEMIDPHIACRIVPLDIRKDWLSGTLRGISH